MRTHENDISLATLFSRSGGGNVRPYVEWERALRETNATALRTKGILATAPASSLDGETLHFDFGEGEKSYRAEISGPVAKAWPEDGVGRDYLIDERVDLLRLDSIAALTHLAHENGGVLDAPLELHPWFAIVRRSLGQQRIVLVFVLDYSRLAHAGSWLAIENAVNDLKAHVRIVVDRVSAQTTESFSFMQSPEIVPVAACTGFYRVPRHLYCHPRAGVVAQDALAVYPERPIVIDKVNETIFFFGRKVTFRQVTKVFDYLHGICLLGDQEVPVAQFCAQALRHHVDEVAASGHVRDARRQAKERLRTEFKDSPEQLKDLLARFIEKHPRGKLKRSFPREDVLIWDHTLALP